MTSLYELTNLYVQLKLNYKKIRTYFDKYFENNFISLYFVCFLIYFLIFIFFDAIPEEQYCTT